MRRDRRRERKGQFRVETLEGRVAPSALGISRPASIYIVSYSGHGSLAITAARRPGDYVAVAVDVAGLAARRATTVEYVGV